VMAMREAGKLITAWRRDGCELGFGAGIAQDYAILGQIGFRTLRLHCHRHGMQSRRTVVSQGEGRADPDQQPCRSRGVSGCDFGGPRKPGAEGSSPSGRGIQPHVEHQRGRRSSQFDRRREGLA
jgi:hypothetical protein